MQKKGKKFTLTHPTKNQIIKEVNHCENCPSRKSLEVHHIKKVRDGGKDTPNNLIVLCHECHKDKAHRGSLSSTEQRKKIRKRTKKLQKAITVILDKAKKRQQKPESNKGRKITRKQRIQYDPLHPKPITVNAPKSPF